MKVFAKTISGNGVGVANFDESKNLFLRSTKFVSIIIQQYATISHLYLQTALHVSGGISTHHQELITLYLQYLALIRPLLLSVVSVTGRSRHVAVTVSIMPDTGDKVLWAPDDGWRYQPKHVEQFADVNKLYIVVSCWIIIDTYYAMYGPLNTKKSTKFP